MDPWRRKRLPGKGGFAGPDDNPDPAPEYGQSPFKMWGSQQTANFAAGVVANNEVQLVSINWGRPETWVFFFMLKLSSWGTNAAATKYFANFRLIVGVGRTALDIPDFAQLQVTVPAAGALPSTAFTSITNPQGQNFLNSPANAQAFVDHFSAADVRVSAILSSQAGTTDKATVEVGASVSILNTAAMPNASRM